MIFCLGSVLAGPLPLMDLCRWVIRQNISKERLESGQINDLHLPRTIKGYLAYKDMTQDLAILAPKADQS